MIVTQVCPNSAWDRATWFANTGGCDECPDPEACAAEGACHLYLEEVE